MSKFLLAILAMVAVFASAQMPSSCPPGTCVSTDSLGFRFYPTGSLDTTALGAEFGLESSDSPFCRTITGNTGFYNPGGQPFCLPCKNPASSSSLVPGKDTCNDPTPPVACPAAGSQYADAASCTVCGSNYFNPNTAGYSCAPCIEGASRAENSPANTACVFRFPNPAISDEFGNVLASIVTWCPPGQGVYDYFGINTLKADMTNTCQACPAGTYSPDFGRHCLSCASATSDGSTDCPLAVRLTCSAGYMDLGDGRCIPCPPGTYNEMQNGVCKPCTTNVLTVYAQTACSAPIVCPAGFMPDIKYSCIACPPNTFSVNGGQCTSCAEKTTSRTGASTCFAVSYNGDAPSTCQAGQGLQPNEIDGSLECDSCPNYTYNDGTMSFCASCPNQAPDPKTTFLDVTKCITTYPSCDPGFGLQLSSTSGQYVCTLCAAGTYGAGTATDNYCVTCAGSAAGASQCGAPLTKCDPGSGIPPSGCTNDPNCCQVCQPGTYNDGSSLLCSSCSTSNIYASTACSPAGVESCVPGTGLYPDPATKMPTCLQCPPLSFNDGRSTSTCIPCLTNDPSLLGATFCSMPNDLNVCKAGTGQQGSSSCTSCLKGSYNSGSSRFCLPCYNSVQVGPGAIACPQDLSPVCGEGSGFSTKNGSPGCYPCAPYTFNDGSSEYCLPCPSALGQGSFTCDSRLNPCLNGQYMDPSTATCKNCPRGTFNDGNSDVCLVCVGSLVAGATACSKVAQVCGAGQYSVDGFCALCGAGFYSSDGTVCKQCAPQTTSGIGASACSSYTPPPPCDPGMGYGMSLIESKPLCTACPAGSYNPAKGYQCIPCIEALTAGMTTCPGNAIAVCLPGQGYPDNNGPLVCANCPAYSYNSGNNYLCTHCKDAAATGSTTCFNPPADCNPGTMDYGSGCVRCPPYSYQPSYGGMCALCQITGYEYLGVTGFTMTGLTTCASPLMCPPGTESTLLGCLPCPPNTYSARGGAGGIGCKACPSGASSTRGSTACTGCKWGSVLSSDGTCQPCPVGTYQVIGVNKCTACTVGTSTTSIGSDSSDPDNGPCMSCSVGMFYSRGVCVSCPAGTYGGGDPTSPSCSACSTGKTSVPGSTVCYSTTCSVGQMNIGGVCKPCDPGTYQPSADGSKCLSCPPNTTSTASGSSACAASTSSVQCLAGTIIAGQDCVPCAKGSWSGANASSCVPCKLGSSTVSAGARSVAECGSDEAHGYCLQGTYFDKSYGVCQACGQGFYGIAEGADSEKTGCARCRSHVPFSVPGTENASGCAAFPADAGTCNPGYFPAKSGNADGSISYPCAPCPPGTFSDTVSRTGLNTTCVDCGTGFTSYVFGATACVYATPPPTLYCDPGYYVSNYTPMVCTPCPINTYSAAVNSQICANCPTGESSPVRSTSKNACKNIGTKCPPGTYSSGSVCALCPAGTWSNADGATSDSKCTPCLLFTGSPAGSSSDQCGTGGPMGCPLGTYYSSSSYFPLCMQCSIGDYGVMGDMGPICVQCPDQMTSYAVGATSCVAISNTMAPTMAPVLSAGTFSLDMSLVITGVSAEAFMLPVSQLAFTSTLQAVLLNPKYAANAYTITNLKATYPVAPLLNRNNRRALQSASPTACAASFTVSLNGGSGATSDIVKARLYVAVNGGTFDAQLAQYAAVYGANDLQDASASSPNFTPASAGGGGGGGGSSSGGATSKKGPGAAIGGAIGAIVVLGIIYYYYNNNQKSIARQAAEQSAHTGGAQNPMQKTPAV